MATVDYDFRNAVGARLDDNGNNPCIFRHDQDVSLPVQYQSVTIDSSDGDGVVLVIPTGGDAPAITEQTTGSPGTGTQHINEILWDDAGESAIRLRWLCKVPAAFTTVGVNTRHCNFIVSQKANVGGSDNHCTGVEIVAQGTGSTVHIVRHNRFFNEGSFTSDAASQDTITEGTEFAAGDFLLIVLYKRLPNGIGGGQTSQNFKVYNMGSSFTTVEGMLDWNNGTLIAQTQGGGEYVYNSADHDEVNLYGYSGLSISGTAVGLRLTYLRAEQYAVPTLAMDTGFPAGSTGDKLVFDAGADEDVYLPLQLDRSGNLGNVDLTVQTAPTTTGLTVSILTDIDATNNGLVGVTAAADAQTGDGSFVLRATFADTSTVDLTVNYTVVAAPRSGGQSVYLSALPANDIIAGSSTIQRFAPEWRAKKDTRCQGGNNWTTPSYAAEATFNFGISTSRIDSDWLKDESNGAASPGATGRLIQKALLAASGTRKVLTIPPVSNAIGGIGSAAAKAFAVDWLQYLVNHQLDVYTQEVGIRLADPTATGTAATGGSTSVIRCSGGTLSTTPGTYDDKWVTVEVGTDLYEVAEIETHTMDSGTLVLALKTQSGQASPLAAVPVNGAEVNIHAETLPNVIKEFNAFMPNFADSGHADYISAPNGAAVHHEAGFFGQSCRYLDNGDSLWTHQSTDGDNVLADLFLSQWSEAILSRASVAVSPSTVTLDSGTQDFSVTVNGADNYGEDVFPTNLIPEANTWTVSSGTGSINASTGLYTSAGGAATVRNTLTYNSAIYGEATVSLTPPTPDPEDDTTNDGSCQRRTPRYPNKYPRTPNIRARRACKDFTY